MYDKNNRYDKNPDYGLVDDESGICPVCGKESLSYGVFELVDGGGYYPCACDSCEWKGKEWYTMHFVELMDEGAGI